MDKTETDDRFFYRTFLTDFEIDFMVATIFKDING